MQITGTHIAYLHACHRKLWLFANGIQMEHTSDIVADGKLIAETTYLDRARKYTELAIDGIKIDFYDAKNRVVHEVKKSDSKEIAHEWQVKFYLWVLLLNDINGATGILEYPKFRETKQIFLSNTDIEELKTIIGNANVLLKTDDIPSKIQLKYCKSCSYYELCYIDE